MSKSGVLLLLIGVTAFLGCSEDDGGADPSPGGVLSDAGEATEDGGGEDLDVDGVEDVEGDSAECLAVPCDEGEFFDEVVCLCVVEDFDPSPEDFECLTNWEKVRRFRIANGLGRLDEALDVANNPEGGVYPVGTIIQLVPVEAMVKRAEGFSPETNNWEFFSLSASVDGTEIVQRGTAEVNNMFGGNCLDCHAKAEPQFDFVCEQTHGCDPLPIGEDIINTLQETDPRCD